jgi:hypothetical protein
LNEQFPNIKYYSPRQKFIHIQSTGTTETGVVPARRSNLLSASTRCSTCSALARRLYRRVLDLTGHPHARAEPGNVNKKLRPLFLCLLIKN